MVEAVHWVGQRALLVEFSSLAEVMAFHRQLNQSPLAGQREAIAAARTVLLDFRARSHAIKAFRAVRRVRPKTADTQDPRQITIDVHYDGADLHDLAAQLQISQDALIDWHSSTVWIGAFCGFAPGFTYCVPEQAIQRKRTRKTATGWDIPRRDSPRTRVPSGAVALAGEFSAVYPRVSPGGWQLIGSTTAPLWDSARQQPALIGPGDHVRYRRITEAISVSDSGGQQAEPASGTSDPVLEVIAVGLRTLVQDLGRPGFADLGVPRSGAADIAAARQANRLVGNADSAAVFEILQGGFIFEARETLICAVTGAQAQARILSPREADARAGSGQGYNARTGTTTGAIELSEPQWEERDIPSRAPFWIFPGERFALDDPSAGLRSYLAISGGIDAAEELGSCATDTLSGLGPAAVAAGQEFGLAGTMSRFVGIADVAPTALPVTGETTVLRFIRGPRADYFSRSARHNPGIEALQRGVWQVSQDSDRVGLRMQPGEGAAVVQTLTDTQLPSEPLIRGAIQIPPDGEPVLFLADHPLTGGYPVIGVIVRSDVNLAAQLPPGSPVRFQQVDPETLLPAGHR